MNKENYKAIAKIIKSTLYNLFPTNEGYLSRDIDLINRLADYFEKEGTEREPTGIRFKSYFDREQFLKECGVE